MQIKTTQATYETENTCKIGGLFFLKVAVWNS